MQIGVITNPNSRKNKGRPNRANELQDIVGDLGEVHTTDSVDSIKPILRDFLRRRARYWVADGGDGALHWMVRKGFEVLAEPEFCGQNIPLPVTVPTNGGTIDFVATNVGIEGKAEDILGRLRHSIETGKSIDEVEVDSMIIEGVERTADGPESFRTYGFACAAGGVGQRFYRKYYEHADPTRTTIVKVVSQTVASMPFAFGPLRQIPGLNQLGSYARDVFAPVTCKVTMDGMELPHNDFTGVHIASMSINLGGVFRFFGEADRPGLLHGLVGSPSPFAIARNIPQMYLGKEIRGSKIIDRACREMTIEATGDELLSPIIDGEWYENLEKVSFRVGPRVRIPKVVGR
jgi:diacylglycerol kinase family enzyme